MITIEKLLRKDKWERRHYNQPVPPRLASQPYIHSILAKVITLQAALATLRRGGTKEAGQGPQSERLTITTPTPDTQPGNQTISELRNGWEDP